LYNLGQGPAQGKKIPYHWDNRLWVSVLDVDQLPSESPSWKKSSVEEEHGEIKVAKSVKTKAKRKLLSHRVQVVKLYSREKGDRIRFGTTKSPFNSFKEAEKKRRNNQLG